MNFIERMMRDVMITQIYEGSNQIQRIIIGREVIAASSIEITRFRPCCCRAGKPHTGC